MKKDLTTRADVELLVGEFYRRVREDKLLAPIFNDVVHIDWNKHLPLMVDFWCSILFYAESYEGNPMVMHEHLGKITPLTRRHFDRWVSIFQATVKDLFSGEKATVARQKARRIANVLEAQISVKPHK